MLRRLILGLVVAGSSAWAEEAAELPFDYTAEAMLELCNGEASGGQQDMQSMVCTFRLQGVVDTMMWNCSTRNGGYDPAPSLTAGDVPSKGSARQAFKNYMADHPERWGEPWSLVAALAISETFPCTF